MTRYEIGFIKRAEELGYDGEALLEKFVGRMSKQASKRHRFGRHVREDLDSLVERLVARQNERMEPLLSTEGKVFATHPVEHSRFYGTMPHGLDTVGETTSKTQKRVNRLLSKLDSKAESVTADVMSSPSAKRVFGIARKHGMPVTDSQLRGLAGMHRSLAPRHVPYASKGTGDFFRALGKALLKNMKPL